MSSTTITQTIRTGVPDGTVKLSEAEGRAPLRLSGALNQFKSFNVTPIIGKEFPEANLREWLESPDADELLRDLAITSRPCHQFMLGFSFLTDISLATRRCLLPQARQSRQ